MPSEDRRGIALEAIRPGIERFHAAVAKTTEQISGLLAGAGGTPDDQTAALGFFARGKVDIDRFSAFTPKSARIDQAAEGPTRAAQEVLDSLLGELNAESVGADLIVHPTFKVERDEVGERIAIVGETALERWMTAIGAAFVDAELKYFNQKQQQEAWEWLMQGRNRVERDEYAGYRNILVPVDFSAHTDRIARRAMEMAQQSDAQLTLLHVVDDILMPGEFYDIAVDLELEKKQHEVAHSRMDKLRASIDYPMLDAEVLSGNPGGVINNFSNQLTTIGGIETSSGPPASRPKSCAPIVPIMSNSPRLSVTSASCRTSSRSPSRNPPWVPPAGRSRSSPSARAPSSGADSPNGSRSSTSTCTTGTAPRRSSPATTSRDRTTRC
mgnify:CR=1 FL=1